MAVATLTFADRLAAEVERKRSQLVVGLDPNPDLLPVELRGDVGLSSVGAVVGATHPRAVAEARRLMPRTILLLPGVGAQGASVADLARAFQSGPASALVAASRSVIYASRESGTDFRQAAGAEAARLRADVWAASGW